MELHDGQKEVKRLLREGNVCVRVGRRWGKNFLLDELAESELKSGKRVIYVAPDHRHAGEIHRLLDYDKFHFFTSKQGLRGIYPADLLILEEPEYFDSCFWSIADPVIKKSDRVIAIGTQDYSARSARHFALLPFEPGWSFYSGDSEENYLNPTDVLRDIKSEYPQRYKTEYGGH